MILDSISVYDADKIPKDVNSSERETFKVHYTKDFPKEGADDPKYNAADYDSDGYRTDYLTEAVSPNETEAIVLDNPNDTVLFEELRAFETIARQKRTGQNASAIVSFVGGEIVAKWNRVERKGVS